ncbi:MAG: Arginine/ornithine antiporter ArcD [uncultured Sulfurovum sp.]|uniref:Arginine/ornithine antiporter ArcD n=1 Tax=uncultured Sulfurovum sp. TaxID=269237 RepID=A0A6S6SYQ5_9BACT|nr:MAG: Arginine/ornithine antiporter ArcD [uncultured Sulfurovum sp.]
MALYDRDYNNNATEAGYTTEVGTATVTFMKQTYQLLGASMISSALGAYLTMPYAATIAGYKWFIFGFVLLMVFFGFNMTRKNPTLHLLALFVFTFALGVMIVPMLAMIIGQGNGALIGNAFLMTSVLFGALSLFAINSKSDFSSWGKPLFITMIIIFVASLVNMFILQSPLMHVIVTAGILLLFSLFTIYDTQNIANGAYDSPVDAAVSLFLDFFNMFTAILQLLGIMGSDD